MRNNVWLAIVAIALAGGRASASELNTLRDIRVQEAAGGAQVVVQGSRAPTFTVFRLGSPDRLVVDLSAADATSVKGFHEGLGPVAGVVASQFSDERASVGRVVVSLQDASSYDVRADGDRVVISVDSSTAKAAEQAPANADPPKPAEKTADAQAPVKGPEAEPAAASGSEAKPAAAEAEKVAKADTAAPAPAEHTASEQKETRENVVNASVDEREVKNPAQRITRLGFQGSSFRVFTDGDVRKFEILELADPPRLALDVYGVSLAARAPKGGSKLVRDVRVGEHRDKVRLVFDVRGQMPRYDVRRVRHGLALDLTAPAKAPAVAAAEKAAEAEIDGQKVALTETEPLAAAAEPPTTGVAEVKDLSFREDPSGGRVEIELDGTTAYKVDRPDPRSAVLTLASAKLPHRLERSLDTSALETPVKTISAFSAPGAEHRVRIVVAASEPFDDTLVKTSRGLAWRLTAKGVKTEEVEVSQQVAGFSGEAPAYAESGAPRQRRYTGKKVSFEFKDIDIHNLLRVIAEVSKRNIVVADDVKGTVTIRLRNVPWDQALELILRSKGLGQERLGNIIRVAPLATLEQEAKSREERRKAQIGQAPLDVRLIPVNYAVANDMAARVKDVLSERGTVTVDTRTNVLIVRDIAEGISKAQALVRSLDTQTPQVLIESRIVEASTNYQRQLGIQWGGHAVASPATGNATGLVFPYSATVAGGSTATPNGGTVTNPEFAVNLPAAVGTGAGGALGFAFGSAGGALALNLRLSALENQGAVKTISAPKVTTLDNNTAKISQGVSIPFSQVSASGVNTTFVEARLSLEVTPHITQDGSILMAIKAENNQPDPSNTGANGQPAIQRKEANTQVLVKDGDTTVIGGIYVRRGSNNEAGVPFLSKIPLLGLLFKTTTETEARQELLIFITPRIINRQQIATTL
ncbi:MAG: type IV pilus secretin PilQ [Myxococcaceae bacterium]|nr:type IV pilus secretin PilQ [Myxococcaceae bacterium]